MLKILLEDLLATDIANGKGPCPGCSLLNVRTSHIRPAHTECAVH
jgi:hypothetical protein